VNIFIVKNATATSLWYNNTYKGSDADLPDDFSYVANVILCARNSTGSPSLFYDGKLTQVYVFDKALSGTERATHITNSFSGGDFDWNPFALVVNNTFTVNVKDMFNNTGGSGFTVRLYNQSGHIGTKITDGTGVAVFSRTQNQRLNYTVSKPDYYNVTWASVAVNGTNTSHLYQAKYLNFTVKKKVTNAVVTPNYNIFVKNGRLYTLNGTLNDVYMLSATNRVTFNKTGYYNFSVMRSLMDFSNTTTNNITGVFDSKLNIRLKDYNGTTITTATNVTVSNSSYNFSEICISSVGSCVFNLTQGVNYNIYSNPQNLSAINTSLSVNNLTHNLTFNFVQERSFNISLYDEITQQLLVNETFIIEIISDTNASNVTSINGTFYVSLLVPENYTIRYSSTDYPMREYYQELRPEDAYDIDLYAITFNDSVDTIVYVVDTTNEPVEDAVVKLLRYYVNCNCYEVVEMSKTSSSGETYFNAQSIEGFYKWIVQYEGTTYFMSSVPENLIPDPSTNIVTRRFTINLGSDYFESFRKISSLSDSLTTSFNAITNVSTLVYTWNDAENIVQQSCLKAEYIQGTKYVTQNNSCATGSAGSIYITLPDSLDVKYKYHVTVRSSTTYSSYIPYSGWLDIDDGSDTVFGDYGYFISGTILIFIAFALSFSAISTTVGVGLAAAAMSFIGLAPFSTTFITGILAMIIGLAVFLYRSR
jgi:hypothetical protein